MDDKLDFLELLHLVQNGAERLPSLLSYNFDSVVRESDSPGPTPGKLELHPNTPDWILDTWRQGFAEAEEVSGSSEVESVQGVQEREGLHIAEERRSVSRAGSASGQHLHALATEKEREDCRFGREFSIGTLAADGRGEVPVHVPQPLLLGPIFSARESDFFAQHSPCYRNVREWCFPAVKEWVVLDVDDFTSEGVFPDDDPSLSGQNKQWGLMLVCDCLLCC